MKKLLMVTVLVICAITTSAQGLLNRPGRLGGLRSQRGLRRPGQTVSQSADAEKDRAARKARATQRSQFSEGSATAGFERERDTLFMDIVREAEICQTNLAEYATYPYWPDVMSVVSNFCEKESCVVVDVGHHFGSWSQSSWWQGCGKKAYVVRCNLETRKRFEPQCRTENGNDGFCVISRGGSYTNVACRGAGSVIVYDSDGRFVEMYDSLDKIPDLKQCLDDKIKANYGKQDRWMKTHGFSEGESGQAAEMKLDAARTNAIERLRALHTILGKFPQWKIDSKWHHICDVSAELKGPSVAGFYRSLFRRPSSDSEVNTNDVVFVKMNERFENLGHSQDQLIEEFVRILTGLEFGSSTDTNGVLDLKFNLGAYENFSFDRAWNRDDGGVVNSVTLIAEFDPPCEQRAIHEKLDQSLSLLLSAIGMDRDALTYKESTNVVRPLLARPRRQAGDQDWKSIQSFSRRFKISRSKRSTGEYIVTISDQRKGGEPEVDEFAARSGLLGGSLRARRMARQQTAQEAAKKQTADAAAKDAERQAQAEQEKAEREAERAQQRQQLMAIQEELRRLHEAKQQQANSAETENGTDKIIACRGASNRAEEAVVPSVRKEDFKAKLTGIAIIEGGRMCGYESRARKADFQSPDSPMEIPYGKAACFRVEYDFPEGYQARMWTRDRWQKGGDGSSYYFGSNPSPLYKGKGVAYGFLDMLERGKTCTLKRLAIQTNADPKLEGLSNGWDIVVAPVDIKFHGPEIAQKASSKEDEKIVLNNKSQGTNSVADKLQGCDFLLNKDFKKNAKFYLCLFSASWCPPCRREMPRIAKTYADTLKDDPDIELIHFSRDQNDEKALAWAKEHDVKFPVVKPKGGNPLDLHSRGIPHLFIVKADGTLLEEGHPMRIFNEEKFRELKGAKFACGMKPQTNNGGDSANGCTEKIDGYTWSYRVNNGEAEIVAKKDGKFTCAVSPKPTGCLVIPSVLGGMKVASIGQNAFYCCSELTSVTIPPSVRNIGYDAFFDCRGLTSVTIPNGVTTIGGSAFSQCSGLTSVTFPSSVTSLGEYSFYYCSRLKSVMIPSSVTSIGGGSFNNCRGLLEFVVEEGNPAYCSVDGVLYNKDRTSLIQYPCAKAGILTIPSSVTRIGHGVLLGCRGLLEFVVEEGNPAYCSVDGILYNKERTKLIQCPGGRSGAVRIPDGVTSIGSFGYWAFRECSGLTSVVIPSSVTSIGGLVFTSCNKLTSVTICGERPDVGDKAFIGCDRLTAIHVPAKCKSWAGMKEWQGIPLVFDAESK